MTADASTLDPVHAGEFEHSDTVANQAFGFWIYLMTDLVLFASIFATFAVLSHNYAGGPTGKDLFDLRYLFVETMLLLISSATYGLAVLAPTVIGGLYWKRANRYGAAASILAGEGLVLAFYFGALEVPGILPVVPILLASAAVFVAVSLCSAPGGENAGIVIPIPSGLWPWAAGFALLFILGNDFWAWNREPTLALGLPVWVWYYIGLGIILSIVYLLFLRRTAGPESPARSEL